MANERLPKADVLQGTLDLMVLRTLSTIGPLHGYALSARLEQASGGAIQLNMGTLYPALMRLEHRPFLPGDWPITDPRPKTRSSTITPPGPPPPAPTTAESAPTHATL